MVACNGRARQMRACTVWRMTDYQRQIETLMLALEAALIDVEVLELATASELEALHDFSCQYIVEILNTLTDEELFGPEEHPEVVSVTNVAERCWSLLLVKRSWTVFSTCKGDSTCWVAGGEVQAVAAFSRHIGADPFSECEQCGDTVWHVVDVSENDQPAAGASVITADEVAMLLANTP